MTFPIISIGFVGKKDLAIPVIFEFADIMNTPVPDPSDINDWITFWGERFSSVQVFGNEVHFFGGSAQGTPTEFYDTVGYRAMVKKITDISGVFTTVTPNSLREQTSLEYVNLQGATGFLPANCCLGSAIIEFYAPLINESIGNLSFSGTPLALFDLSGITGGIGLGAFQDTAISGIVNFPLASGTIGNGAFQNTDITEFLGPNITGVIGNNAFNGCASLIRAVCPLVTSIGTGTAGAVFMGTDSLSECNYPNATYVTGNAFYSTNPNLTSVDLRSAVQIFNGAFRGCSAVTLYRLDACTQLGTTAANNNIFLGNTGNTITCYLPLATQTDGDAVYLASNNTVTFIP